MRPLFGVRLVPSTPMKDDKTLHVRIFQNDVRQRLLAICQRVERNVLRTFRNAKNHARILDRERILWARPHTGTASGRACPTVTSSVMV